MTTTGDIHEQESGHSSVGGIEDDPRYGAFGQTYYAACDPSREDLSADVVENNRTVARLSADLVAGTIGWSGLPARVFLASGESVITDRTIVRVLEPLIERAQKARLKVRIGFAQKDDVVDCVGCAAMRLGAEVKLTIAVVADLTRSETELRRDLRKRFGSHVNWGEKNLQMTLVERANLSEADFNRYRRLHREAAGRDTRPEASWRAQFDAIRGGQAFLVLASLPDHGDVASTYIGLGRRCAVYWSGAYRRELFDKPLGHYPMYAAMLHSKKLGLAEFDLGEFPPPSEGEKVRAIGYFKRGFTSRRVARMTAEWDYAATELKRADTGASAVGTYPPRAIQDESTQPVASERSVE